MGRAIQVMFYAGRELRNENETTTPTIVPETTPNFDIDEIIGEETAPAEPGGGSGGGYRVILYDDDYHGMDEVAAQIHKATQYPPMRCWEIMLEVHNKGRAICYKGSRAKCHDVARVLREIRLQCEVDCD